MVLGCSDDAAAPTDSAAAVTISEQWAKAADSGMSAAFGQLHNGSDRTVTVVSAASPASATVELHEVVTGDDGVKVMRPKPGGFAIPANGELDLEPGGNHIMFMGLNGPLRTGSEAPVTLTFDDGSTTTFTAQVRDFPGNQENYEPGGDHGDGAAAPAHGG
ncbi:copper chaperone PCu(A)C [Nocardia cyriacigeorgica]|uniref:Copper chaperone PCu(A)C n=1 Tax=Nocardia cyriacigeorgica TaxID=135487 RepID=A0A6P1DCQ2_9NOCA|nr:copper chaperone PCu(A)C [Nocardia cyriacigeorgica]NEW37396.1 copper chaperone PCu(A)C [Nocardia cyriacigeorgica]NEW46172.1 copper chaperone PCu(A)C [Nocardia cyriacigeorgica]NEW50596.1 copper chaperone PCu(A)C [Nocardia cyriacigeorgica]NEW58756.1 copper chaperone PCu(A)C [Nocardia cyriacigeorgica]